MVDIELSQRIADTPAPQWDALLPPDAPPFVRHAFLEALERTGCVGPEQGWLPAHLRFVEDGQLVAAAPAYIKVHSDGEFVFDSGWADLARRMRLRYYPKLVVAVPFTPATGVRLLAPDEGTHARMLPRFAAALQDLIASPTLSSAHVLFPTEQEASALEDLGFASRYGVQYQWHNEGFDSFESWLTALPSKRRTQIRHERREVERQGVRVETLRGATITEEVIGAMYRFYASTVDKHVWGHRYLSEQFFFEVAERLPDVLEIVLASVGNVPVAGALNFASNGVLYGRYWGSDADRPYLHFEVCYYHSIADAIARKLRRFEPGAGGEHKRVRGFRPTVTHSVHLLAHTRLNEIVRRHVAEEREQIRRYTSGASPDP